MRFREGEFLKSCEDIIFEVKGLVHPPGYAVAYVRYVPKVGGRRFTTGLSRRGYVKVYDLDSRYRYLERYYPEYVRFDPVLNCKIQVLPTRRISIRFNPEEKLRELRRRKDLDELQKRAVELAELIVKYSSGLKIDSIGVTGSILVDLHGRHSDVDLVVYGERESFKAREAMESIFEEGLARRYEGESLRKLYNFRMIDTPIPFKLFSKIERRKNFQGLFKDRDFFIRYVKKPEEYGERYGDRVYRKIGVTRVKAEVLDDKDSIFTPCIYKVKVLEGEKEADLITEITSFRGRFCEQASQGDVVVVRGTLEEVYDLRTGEVYRRIVVGSRGDYMYPLAYP